MNKPISHQLQYYYNNKERIKAEQRERYQRNKAKIAAIRKQYYQDNREKCINRVHQWRAKQKENS